MCLTICGLSWWWCVVTLCSSSTMCLCPITNIAVLRFRQMQIWSMFGVCVCAWCVLHRISAPNNTPQNGMFFNVFILLPYRCCWWSLSMRLYETNPRFVSTDHLRWCCCLGKPILLYLTLVETQSIRTHTNWKSSSSVVVFLFFSWVGSAELKELFA